MGVQTLSSEDESIPKTAASRLIKVHPVPLNKFSLSFEILDSRIMDTACDARIRDPVPIKLKGEDVAASGSFSVMVVNLASEVSAKDRHSAAKRSSENTVQAAKLADTNGYVSTLNRRMPAFSGPVCPDNSSPPDGHGSLLSTNTKTEQARLLTLLRSLHPVLVVDQLCKALDFFGSKQKATAHSAEDGFPDSAVGNGPGPLFVSWMSEIFPGIDVIPTTGTTHADPITTQAPYQYQLAGAGTWSPRRTNASDRLATTPSRQGAAASGPAADHRTNEAEGDRELAAYTVQATYDCQTNNGLLTTVPDDTSHIVPGEVGVEDAATTRRRGRPKGSRNKPKSTANPNTTTTLEGLDTTLETVTAKNQTVDPASVTGWKRRGRGRPKGSKNKPKHTDALLAAGHNSPSAVDAGTGPGQVASNPSGAHELARPSTALDESRLSVFNQMMADVTPRRVLPDSAPLPYKRRRIDAPRDQSQSRLALCSHGGQNAEGHAASGPGSPQQHTFPIHRGTSSGLYFAAPPNMDFSDACSGFMVDG